MTQQYNCDPENVTPNSNSGEAALKGLLDLRFAFLFWALALAVGYGHLGTYEIRIWIQQAGVGYYPAMLALLALVGSIFVLLGIFPFHTNKVDLMDGAHPMGSLTLFLGLFFIIGTSLCRLADNGALPTHLIATDTVLALLCLSAFIVLSLSALDQRTIDRLLGFLLIANCPLLIPLIHFFNFQSSKKEHFIVFFGIYF